LIGCALGDSLGLPKEGLRARRARKLFGNDLRQCLFAGMGAISDDTQQSAMAYLAIQRHPDDPEAAAAQFARMLKKRFLTIPPGVGLATVKASLKLLAGVKAAKSGVNSAGNGAAMRAPVIGCLLADDPEKRAAFVVALSRVTHTHPLAIQGAQIVADAAAALCRNAQEEFWSGFAFNIQTGPTTKECQAARRAMSSTRSTRFSR